MTEAAEASVVGGAVEEVPATVQDQTKGALDEIYPSMRDKTPENGAESADSETDEPEAGEPESDEAKDAENDDPKDDDTDKPKAAEADAGDYTFEVPEGFELSEERTTQFSSVASKYKMDQKDAQGLLNLHFQMLAENEVQANKRFQETRKQWVEEGKKDPQFGGENYKQAKQDVARAMNLVGDDDLRKFLNYGAGDHPAVFRTFAKIGQHVREGSFRITTVGTNAGQGGSFTDHYPNSPDLK